MLVKIVWKLEGSDDPLAWRLELFWFKHSERAAELRQQSKPHSHHAAITWPSAP
jgi:hypothetical protein